MRLTSKGQVTIPLVLRERYGLDPLAEVVFEPAEGGALIRPAADHRLKSLHTALRRARGSADAVERALSGTSLVRLPLSDTFVKDVSEVVKPGQKVQ